MFQSSDISSHSDGTIFNQMVNFDNYTIRARIIDPKKVFFSKDGIDINASNPKW